MTHKLYIRAIKHHDFSHVAPKNGLLVVRYMDGKRPGVHLYYGGPLSITHEKIAEQFQTPFKEIIGSMSFNLEGRILNLSGGASIPKEAMQDIQNSLKEHLNERGLPVIYTDTSDREPFNPGSGIAEVWQGLGFPL